MRRRQSSPINWQRVIVLGTTLASDHRSNDVFRFGPSPRDSRRATFIATRSVLARAVPGGAPADLMRFATLRLSELSCDYWRSVARENRVHADAATHILDQAEDVVAAFECALVEVPAVTGEHLPLADQLRAAVQALNAWVDSCRPRRSVRLGPGAPDKSAFFLPVLSALTRANEQQAGHQPNYPLIATLAATISPALPMKHDAHALRTAISRYRAAIGTDGSAELRTLEGELRTLSKALRQQPRTKRGS
jgi:hypothetical protein